MNYTIHNLQQGSPEWLRHRAGCLNASDLAAAMGASSYKTRTALIRELATGITAEVDAATQKRFDDGHRFEALARPLAEHIIGRELYPITASIRVEGLTKPLSASLDGTTDDDSVNFEHKTLNTELAAALDEGVIPPEYWPQMEQGMFINGAVRTLFMASKWDDNDQLLDEKHCWYESDPVQRAKILPAWRQAEADAADYQHVEPAPVPVAAPIEDLPALAVEISGRVLSTNLTVWQDVVKARIQAINTNLQTDNDFATAESTVKFLEDGEKRLDLVKAQAQAQAADIDAVFRAIDQIRAEMRAKRLELDKLVKSRKDTIRAEIFSSGAAALTEHVAALNNRLGRNLMPAIPADFAGVMKGKRTITSLRDAVATELARAKIAASEIADRIEINKKVMEQLCDPAIIFPDFAQVCTKPPEDFANLVAMRVAQHKEAEDKRLEAERERIRQEEATKQAAPAAANTGSRPAASAATTGTGDTPASGQRETPPQADTGARMKLGDINARLYPLAVTAEALKHLGFESVGTERAAKLYRSQDFPAICAALIHLIQRASSAGTQAEKVAA